MAVLTSSHYHASPKLKIRDNATSVLVADIAFAKYLSPYTDTATVKSLFYLDKVLRDSTLSPNGFIGIVTTASKIAMHNSSRLFAMKDGAGYYCLDAGLNTKGELILGGGTYITSDLSNNGFKLTATYKSSYFNNTTSYGINWRKQGTSTYTTKSLGTINSETSVSLSTQIIDVDGSDTLFVEAPYTYEVQAFITNSEGTTLQQLLNVTMSPLATSYAFGTTTENAYLYGNSTTYYRSRRQLEGGTLYSNSSGTIPVAAGFYMDKTGSAPYFYVQCNSSGQIIGFSEYNPAASRVAYWPSGFGGTLAEALIDANSKGWNSSYTIYLDLGDSKYYSGTTGDTYVANGYWVIGDNDQNYEEIHTINGVAQ